MPAQVFLDRDIADGWIQVLQTYDAAFAREAFAEMEPVALYHLAESLAIDGELNLGAAPNPSADYVEALWKELLDSARENGLRTPFFVVRRFTSKAGNSFLYVSADWPSAEGFAEQLA